MEILKLVTLKKDNFSSQDTSLRKECEEVVDFGETLQNEIDNLLATFSSHAIAVGLAAPQVGINKKISVINPNKKDHPDDTIIIVNPKILSTSGKKDTKSESCMSLPHYKGEVTRRSKIKVGYQDRLGVYKEVEASGFLARIFFHEIDHLNGFLYIDRMEENSQLESVDFFDYD